MNKQIVLFLAALVVLVGCNRSTDLAVRVTTTDDEGNVTGRAQLPVRLLPYDRDSIFDALAAQADRPEPEPPQDLVELRDSIAAAQEAWRDAESQWNEARSELQELSDRMQQMDRSSSEYFQAFQQFEELETRESRLGRQKDALFERFTELQSAYNERADSFAAVLSSWADLAFEDYGEIVDSLLEAQGREEHWDTTGGSGWAAFNVPGGQWWVHTRYKLPFEELYWNLPTQLEGGSTDTLVLNEENAALRPVF